MMKFKTKAILPVACVGIALSGCGVAHGTAPASLIGRRTDVSPSPVVSQQPTAIPVVTAVPEANVPDGGFPPRTHLGEPSTTLSLDAPLQLRGGDLTVSPLTIQPAADVPTLLASFKANSIYVAAAATVAPTVKYGLMTISKFDLVPNAVGQAVATDLGQPVWIVGWDRIPDAVGPAGAGGGAPAVSPNGSALLVPQASPRPTGQSYATYYEIFDGSTGKYLYAINDGLGS